MHEQPTACFFAYSDEDVRTYGNAHKMLFDLWAFDEWLRGRIKYHDEAPGDLYNVRQELHKMFEYVWEE